MLIVRRVPCSVAPVAAGLATGESLAALVLAHTAAGGALPSAPWVLALAVVGYGAGLVVLGRGLSIRLVAPAMVGVQLLMHAWLVALPGARAVSGHALHAGHGGTGGSTTAGLEPALLLGLSPTMVVAHVVAGLVAAAAWGLRRRAVRVLTEWIATTPVTVVGPLRRGAVHRVWIVVGRAMFRASPTRGPPPGTHPAAAA